MKKINFIKRLSLSIISVVIILIGCNAVVEELTGPSALGNTLGIKGIYGGAGIQNDGASMATIRVEVFATGNIPTVGATVTLTTTLGILAATSLITGASGAAVTTLTSGLVTGMAFVTATVDNVSATTAVPII
jgi:hypothetical protein